MLDQVHDSAYPCKHCKQKEFEFPSFVGIDFEKQFCLVVILSVCDEYTYLGVVFNVNGNFKKAINKQVSQVKHAMFALLTKAAKLHLP